MHTKWPGVNFCCAHRLSNGIVVHWMEYTLFVFGYQTSNEWPSRVYLWFRDPWANGKIKVWLRPPPMDKWTQSKVWNNNPQGFGVPIYVLGCNSDQKKPNDMSRPKFGISIEEKQITNCCYSFSTKCARNNTRYTVTGPIKTTRWLDAFSLRCQTHTIRANEKRRIVVYRLVSCTDGRLHCALRN